MYHETLQICRKVLGLSQTEIADAMGVSKQHISFIEKGHKNNRYFANCNYYRMWLIEYVENNKEKLHEGAVEFVLPLLKNLGS